MIVKVIIKFFTTPSIVINDKVVPAGRGTAEKDLERMVRKVYDAQNLGV